MDNVTFRTLDGADRAFGVEAGLFAPTGSGRTLDLTALHTIRGLVDAHAHLASDSLEDATSGIGQPPMDAEGTGRTPLDRAWSQLESGVFLLFDKGAGSRAHLSILSEPPDRRPEMEMAGTILYPPGGYYPGFSPREVDLSDLPTAIAAEAVGPASWVKVVGDWPRPGQGAVPNFSEAQLAKVVEVAHEAGCRVAIHAAAPNTSTMAVAAGVDSIEHGLFLTDDDLRALGARGGAWVPTITAMSGIRDSLRAGSSGWTLFDSGLANAKRRLRDAPDSGVVVLAGTDLTVPHGDVAVEGVALSHAGLGPALAVHALTDAGYSYAGRGEPFVPGASADLVSLRADPREDISALLNPVVVMRRGRILVDRR